MIIECPNCGTKFRLADEQIEPQGSWTRCGNCQNVFQVFPETPGEPAAAAPAAAPQPDAEASPAFDLDLGIDLNGDDSGAPAASPAADPAGELGVDDPFDLDGGGGKQEASGDGRGGFFKAVFWVIGIIILLAVLGAGGLIAMNRLNMAPEVVAMFKDMPGLSVLLASQEQEPNMPMSSVRGYYRVSEKSGRIFVIRGLVENANNAARTKVMVRARLSSAENKVLREAVFYAGPVFTDEELRQLSIKEIQARLGSPKGPDGSDYAVAPGGTIPFMVVFANPPANAKAFTTEVMGSKALGEKGK